jgi:hypothetical protein
MVLSAISNSSLRKPDICQSLISFPCSSSFINVFHAAPIEFSLLRYNVLHRQFERKKIFTFMCDYIIGHRINNSTPLENMLLFNIARNFNQRVTRRPIKAEHNCKHCRASGSGSPQAEWNFGRFLDEQFIQYKTCFSILSTTFVWNISHSRKNSAGYYHRCT